MHKISGLTDGHDSITSRKVMLAIACGTLCLMSMSPATAKEKKKYARPLQKMEGQYATEKTLKGSVEDQGKIIPMDPNSPVFSKGTPFSDSLAPTTLNSGASQASKNGASFNLGVTEKVPRTPEAVANYFRRMKAIINAYDSVTAQILLGSGGLNTDPASIESARQETLKLVAQVRAIVPPEEIAPSHNALATTMANLGSFLTSAPSLEQLATALSLVGEVKGTMERYQSGCSQCIAYYKLDPKLNPFSDEDPATAAKFANGVQQLQSQKMNEAQQMMQGGMGAMLGGMLGGGGGGNSGGGMDMSGLGSLLGGGGLGGLTGGGSGGGSPVGSGFGLGNGGGLGGFGGAGGLGGGNSLGGGGGLGGGGDLGGLGSMLGGMMGQGGNGGSPDMGAMMKQLQGLMGGQAAGGQGQTGPGGDSDMMNQLQQMMQDGNQ